MGLVRHAQTESFEQCTYTEHLAYCPGAAKRKLSEGQATNKSKKRSKLQHRVTVVGPIWDLNKAKGCSRLVITW